MRESEQSFITGSLEVTTPEGPIRLSIAVSTADHDAVIARRHLPSHDLYQLVKSITYRIRRQEREAADDDERTRRNPLYGLVPKNEIVPVRTEMALSLLNRRRINSLEKLASLKDEDISDKVLFRGAGKVLQNYIKHLRELAQERIEQTSRQVGPEGVELPPTFL